MSTKAQEPQVSDVSALTGLNRTTELDDHYMALMYLFTYAYESMSLSNTSNLGDHVIGPESMTGFFYLCSQLKAEFKLLIDRGYISSRHCKEHIGEKLLCNCHMKKSH